jgi:RNA polymerase sigma-54 factor
MRLEMGHSAEQRTEMGMRPSPSLIQFAEILALTGAELQDAIIAEVADNPAIDLDESPVCPACGDFLLRNGTCFRCSRGETLALAAARDLAESDDDEFDVLTRVADQQSLEEHLLAELGAVLGADDLEVAEFLVGELDDRGFLTTPLDLVAASLRVPLPDVERVLDAVQSVGPLGLAARSVEECLAIQLARWESTSAAHPLARPIVEDHLEELGQGKYAAIARSLGAEYEDVIAARDFIRSHLRPYPIAEPSDLEPWVGEEGPGFIAPDVIVRLTDKGEIDIEVVESRRFVLSINPMYRDLARRLEDGRTEDAKAGISSDDQRHVQAQVARARQFLTHVTERRDTLRRVSAYVMARQEEYLRHGPRHLVPLTRAEVATALELHESTISRAVGGKYVLLPSRQIVKYSIFFKAALSVHDVLRELVANEDHPLTDSELAEELAARGLPIARRTVAKYRNEMGILPSSLR